MFLFISFTSLGIEFSAQRMVWGKKKLKGNDGKIFNNMCKSTAALEIGSQSTA